MRFALLRAPRAAWASSSRLKSAARRSATQETGFQRDIMAKKQVETSETKEAGGPPVEGKTAPKEAPPKEGSPKEAPPKDGKKPRAPREPKGKEGGKAAEAPLK